MSEDEARDAVSRIAGAAIDKMERLVALVLIENSRQNLISKASESEIWVRHILDSAQLAALTRASDQRWADIGTGAGFPGLVLATLDRWDMVLIEPRRRRAEFLSNCIQELELNRVAVICASAQQTAMQPCDVISARAVAPTASLLRIVMHLAHPSTRFIFPKGQHARRDVETACRDWHGVFHVEQSRTNSESEIVVIDRVRAR